MSDLGAALRDAFGSDRVREHAALAPFTTFKVGGPADWLLELHGPPADHPTLPAWPEGRYLKMAILG